MAVDVAAGGSLFGRLFTYARSDRVSQLENFTTEALAASIRADPGPFVALLERSGALQGDRSGTHVLVSTQEVVPDLGVIDLVVRRVRRTEIVGEAWVEVKVWAGQSGDQLARYQRAIASRNDGIARGLVVLGPRQIAAVDAIPWLTWQAVRDQISRSGQVNPLWHEMSAFLEERNVADASTDPLSAREASSLLDAHALFLKATRVLTEVSEAGRTSWPAWGWGSKDQITQGILGQFQRHARYTIATGVPPTYLILGYTDLHATGEAHLTVWVENNPRKVDVRMATLQSADEGGLDPVWIRRTDTWQALSRTHRAATIEGVDATVKWFVDRLAELADAGLLPLPDPAPAALG